MADFVEPREVIPLIPEALAMLASETHRLHHAVWHDVRGAWDSLEAAQHAAITDLGWSPGHGAPRAALRRGAPIADNGSGEDFLFMHRQMIGMVAGIYREKGEDPPRAWGPIPAPGEDPRSGFEIPPAWDQSHVPTQRRIGALKSDTYFWTAMRGWDRQFKNAAYLSTLSLGALGAALEFTVHNDMHMRWSSVPRDPLSGNPVPDGRDAVDFDPKWLQPHYDYLGEFYSSHVNPIFWRLHGWVDDRIDDWFRAHEVAHPGEVERIELEGVQWFKPGRWVSGQEPWAQPKGHHDGHHGHGGLDPETMRNVIRILHPPEARLMAEGRRAQAPDTWFLD